MAISPDGKTAAACSRNGHLLVLDARTGKLLRRSIEKLILPKEKLCHELYRLEFSPDSKYVASVFAENSGRLRGDEHLRNAIQIWNVATGKEIARVTVPPKEDQRFAVAALAISPDRRMLAFGMYGDTAVRIWEIASGKERARLEGHQGVVSALAFSPDGRYLASGSADSTILMWDLQRKW